MENSNQEPHDAAKMAQSAQQVKSVTENLADLESSIYKHEHSHHHHHHHHHHHLRIGSMSFSDLKDGLELLFKTIYAYPYIFLVLSVAVLIFFGSSMPLSVLSTYRHNTNQTDFYRWQEFFVLNRDILIRIPFQFTLAFSGIVLLYIFGKRERHWQRDCLKILPALIAAALFSLPAIGASNKTAEEFSRVASCDSLLAYYEYCEQAAADNGGAFPSVLPEKPRPASKYGASDYIYHGLGKKTTDAPFLLFEDLDGRHAGNFRFAVRSDGQLMLSKYGQQYHEYTNPHQPVKMNGTPKPANPTPYK